MTELLPSRKDENFRYTQISLATDGWTNENLGTAARGEARSEFAPWAADFYLAAATGAEVVCIQPPTADEWIFLKSSGGSERTRGLAEIVVPKGKSYKVFEVIDQQSERTLLFRNIRLEEGATLEYFVWQNQSLANTFILRHFADLAANSQMTLRFYHQGGKKGQHRIASRVGQNARFTLEGATRLQNAQHVDIWAESQHVGPDSYSQTTVWNVLSDQSVAVFNGMIRILENCPRTLGYQSNKTLLLSEKARVYTLPKLEIATDDVKCSHGASVSSLDQDQLFYLRSRGISPEQAQKMLIEAFTMPVLQFIPKHLLSDEERERLGVKGEIGAF